MRSTQYNWLKIILQWGVFLLIIYFILCGIYCNGKPADPEAFCPFGGLQVLSSYLVNNSLACGMSFVQIMMGISLAVGVLLFRNPFLVAKNQNVANL
ncbi:MAG: hypothetical protein LBC84_01555 [Prevotellaceae bacterium]|jgi:ribose/xylose/arabinose/galactoside ABC-type transport system permease subunit|nr:hypothetical protein [Prevotellaceae bacterium]